MTVRTLRAAVGLFSAVRRMKSDSGVVTRMCGGRLSICWRSVIGVSPADRDTEFWHQQTNRQRGVANFDQRLVQVFLDVIAERFQRRDIEHLRLVVEFTLKGVFEKPIDAGEKGGEGLAGTGRRGDESIRPGLDGRPGLNLYVGGVPTACETSR